MVEAKTRAPEVYVMGFAPSTLSLSAIVEHMQADLLIVSRRLLQPGPVSPGVRVLAAPHLRILRARLDSLHAVIRGVDAAESALNTEHSSD